MRAQACAACHFIVRLTCASRQKLEADNKDLKERVLRSLAEVENMRTRAERNVADARAHGQQKFAESLLEVRC